MFGGDAWTVTYPEIKTEVKEKELSKLHSYLWQISKNVDPLYQSDIRNVLNEYDGVATTKTFDDLFDRLKDKTYMKVAYLEDNGKHIDVETSLKDKYTPEEQTKYKRVLELIPSFNDTEENLLSKYRDGLSKISYDYDISTGATEDTATKRANADVILNYLMEKTLDYESDVKNGRDKITVYDTEKANKEIANAINQNDYEQWLKDKFSTIFGEKGIWNGKDYITDNGRRTYKQLFKPATLENILNQMLKESKGEARGVNVGFFGNSFGDIRATQTKKFSSIQDIINNEYMLQNVDINEDAKANFEKLSDRVKDIAYEIADNKKDNRSNDWTRKSDFAYSLESFGAAAECVKDLIQKPSIESMQRLIDEEYQFLEVPQNVWDNVFQEIMDVKKPLSELATNYFEAKPRRIVELNEVQTAVIPSDASEELKARLNELGINTVEYDKSIEGARQEAVRAQDNLKFSEGMTLEDLKKDNKWVEDTQQVLDEVNGQSQDGEILTVDNIDDILHQRPISQRTLDSIRRTEKIMVEEADKWIKGYDTIRAEYPIFSKNVLNNALYDVLINGDLRPEVRDAMANTLSSEYSFEGINGDIQKDIDEFIKESLETFNNEAKYEAGEIDTESVRRSMAQNEALNQKDIEGSFEAQQRGAALNRMSADIKRDYQAEYQPIVEDLLKNDSAIRETKGKRSDAKVSNWKTMDQNIFALAMVTKNYMIH